MVDGILVWIFGIYRESGEKGKWEVIEKEQSGVSAIMARDWYTGVILPPFSDFPRAVGCLFSVDLVSVVVLFMV